MPPERPAHVVLSDAPDLLDALAVPFGTYRGVAACRPVPGTATLGGILPDVLWGLGKTEALTGRHLDVTVVEAWLCAHRINRLFVLGADGLAATVWPALCQLGDRCRLQVLFVSSQPTRWPATVPEITIRTTSVVLSRDRQPGSVKPPVGAALPEIGFPALPAACAELLEPEAAARAQAIYDDCLVAAFAALDTHRLLDDGDAADALTMALSHTPDLEAVPLAIHAVRAAGLLRGHHLTVTDGAGGVTFEALLTADRLAQLAGLVSPATAAAGVLAGLEVDRRRVAVSADGAAVDAARKSRSVPALAQPLLRAWRHSGEDRISLPASPPRPLGRRHRRLWRTPPPERLRARCEPITCDRLRYQGDPPMDWTRRRHGR